MRSNIIRWQADGSREIWKPITLDQVGKNERFLETVIAESPELLYLETKRTGIYGPFVVFRQRALSTPQGRLIIPDILVLAASGSLIVVEVKLFSNPELRDRRVIAQAIDYAASLSSLDENELAQLISQDNVCYQSWFDLITQLFPDEENAEELAQVFIENTRSGNLHIVIACDRAPAGLQELVRGVSRQSALGFTMSIVEITPFVRVGDLGGDILFVPHKKLTTEIVSRTAITVTYQQGTPQPSVDISTTSIEEVEQNIQAASQGIGRSVTGRSWDSQELEDAFMTTDDPVVRELFVFAKQYSYHGQVMAKGRKVKASFGFYMQGFKPDGTAYALQVYNCIEGDGRVKLYLNMTRSIAGTDLFSEYSQRLRFLFEDYVDIDKLEPYIDTALLADHLDEFKELILWLQKSILQQHVS